MHASVLLLPSTKPPPLPPAPALLEPPPAPELAAAPLLPPPAPALADAPAPPAVDTTLLPPLLGPAPPLVDEPQPPSAIALSTNPHPKLATTARISNLLNVPSSPQTPSRSIRTRGYSTRGVTARARQFHAGAKVEGLEPSFARTYTFVARSHTFFAWSQPETAGIPI